MRRYLILLITLIGSSCGEDFLELTPEDQASINVFYNTPADFDVALAGAYGALRGYAEDLIPLLDVRTDNALATANNRGDQVVHDFTLDATSGLTEGFYNDSYQVIQAANAIINRVEEKDFSQEEKDRISAEAKFLRALAYFYLVNIYGDVPLLLTETTGSNLDETRSIARTPVTQVYDQIELDLQDAEQLPTPFSVPQQASALAAKALLGQIYLFQGQYADAVAKLAEVVNSGQFSLLPAFDALFAIGNATNAESIFVVESVGSANGTGNGLGFDFAPKGFALGSFTRPEQSLYPETNLYEAYTAADSVRRNITAQPYYSPGDEFGADTVYYCRKYEDLNPFEMFNASNTIYMLRYADILLQYAEALNEVGYEADGAAFAQLNQVRARAGIDALSAAELPDQAAFRQAILRERRLELALEGKRWLDLKRTDNAVQVINDYFSQKGNGVTIDQNDLLYPFPQSEVLNNPGVITQNLGY